MKRANKYKQNSRQWYTWRGKGLGASDAPIIMGESPWCTPFLLWAYKVGLLKRPEPNVYQLKAMERGKRLEPLLRKLYSAATDVIVEPDVNCEHPEYEYLRASLDGYVDGDPEGPGCLEGKWGNKPDHERLKKTGKIPDKYYPQVQAQLLVTGLAWCDYVSCYCYEDAEPNETNTDMVIQRVLPDAEYHKKLLRELLEFQHHVKSKSPPLVQTSDLASLVEELAAKVDCVNTTLRAVKLITSILDGTYVREEVNEEPESAPIVDADGFTQV